MVVHYQGNNMKPKITVEVYPQEVNDKTLKVSDQRYIEVTSHWNSQNQINIRIGDNDVYTVIGEDLKRAVDAALNRRSI